jgi:hypothetical protein
MKAAEMAAAYKANPTTKTIADLATEAVMATKTMAEARRIASDSALIAILKEQDDKWRAFARKCPDVNPNGFKIILHQLIPTSKHLLT